jgi:hypothetical protein
MRSTNNDRLGSAESKYLHNRHKPQVPAYHITTTIVGLCVSLSRLSTSVISRISPATFEDDVMPP